MKKQQEISNDDFQIDYRASRNKLIHQNRQLYFQIFTLENKISQLLSKNVIIDFNQHPSSSNQYDTKYKQETENQITLIKQLKRKILMIKNAQKPQEKQQMRQAINQLTFLNKEKQKYWNQKQVLLKKVILRQQALQLNKPLQVELQNIVSKFKSTQRQNNNIKTKILKLQKQINNLHRIKELAKNSTSRNQQNHEIENEAIVRELEKLQKEIKEIEKQWQPKIQELDSEYFKLKQAKDQKEAENKSLIAILNNHKNRVLAMKQEANIVKDKLRLSQIIISPLKRQQINQIYRIEQQKRQFFKQFKQRSNNIQSKKVKKTTQSTSNKTQQKKQQRVDQQNQVSIPFQTFQTSIATLQNTNKLLEKQSLNFNEFELPKSQKSQIEKIKSPTKTSASIAVGTTFYLDE